MKDVVALSQNGFNYNDHGISREGNTKDDHIGSQPKLPQRFVWRNKTFIVPVGTGTMHT